MKTKALIRIVLLAISLGSLAVWGVREYRKSQQITALNAKPKAEETVPVHDGKQVVMTYFRSGVRCTSCKKIEALATETAEKDLSKEMADGKLVFRVVDVDEPANNHFIRDYQLTTKSVVLSYRIDGKELRWENMEKIWDLLDDPDAFRAYLADPIHQYIDS